MNPPDIFVELADELIGNAKTKAAISKLKKENTALLKKLMLAEKRDSYLEQLAAHEPRPVVRRAKSNKIREATACILASDWHVDEEVDPVKVNHANEYSLEIADKRIDKFLEGAQWLIAMHQKQFVVKDAVLWLGGDFFSGYIHEDTKEVVALSPVESSLWLYDRFVNIIDTLAAECKLERLTVPCSIGNHGRTTAKRSIMTGHENSYEYGMYQHLARHYANHPVVEIVAPKSELIYIDVYDKKLRFTHGYQVSSGGAKLPTALDAARIKWDSPRLKADITNTGHFHTYFSGEKNVSNGSLIGYTVYSIEKKYDFEAPCQAFYLIDSERGKCCSTKIWVT